MWYIYRPTLSELVCLPKCQKETGSCDRTLLWYVDESGRELFRKVSFLYSLGTAQYPLKPFSCRIYIRVKGQPRNWRRGNELYYGIGSGSGQIWHTTQVILSFAGTAFVIIRNSPSNRPLAGSHTRLRQTWSSIRLWGRFRWKCISIYLHTR